jgi:hypothetical protein
MTEKALPYHLVKNALTPEQCEAYVKWIDKYATSDKFRPGYRLISVEHDQWHNEEIPFLDPIKKVFTKAQNYFLDNYEIEHTFDMKRFFGNIMETGTENPAHDDDGDYYPDKPEVEKHYSGILMLNSDYEGGELYFEHHNLQVKLEAGDVIMFRGNAENLHGVRPITSGRRINFIFFFRDYIPNNRLQEGQSAQH